MDAQRTISSEIVPGMLGGDWAAAIVELKVNASNNRAKLLNVCVLSMLRTIEPSTQAVKFRTIPCSLSIGIHPVQLVDCQAVQFKRTFCPNTTQ
jgi:hypothetical protein